MQPAFRHFIGPSMPRLTPRSFSEALASYVRLFTEVRGETVRKGVRTTLRAGIWPV